MKYVIENKDGTVGIMMTVSDDINPVAEINKWAAEDKQKVRRHMQLRDGDLPNSDEFCDAWCLVGNDSKIQIHASKARDIQLERMRRIRDQKLAELDIESNRALEDGDNTKLAQVREKKRILRDATNALKALRPSGVADDAFIAQIKELSIVPEV